MALIREEIGKNEKGQVLIRTYSNQNKMIRKKGTDELYEDAVDSQNFDYEETNIEIERPEEG